MKRFFTLIFLLSIPTTPTFGMMKLYNNVKKKLSTIQKISSDVYEEIAHGCGHKVNEDDDFESEIEPFKNLTFKNIKKFFKHLPGGIMKFQEQIWLYGYEEKDQN